MGRNLSFCCRCYRYSQATVLSFSEYLKGAKHGISMEATHQGQPPTSPCKQKRAPLSLVKWRVVAGRGCGLAW